MKDDILNVFEFQQRCCLHIVITTTVKQRNKISLVTLRTVYKHIVADAFFSKKNLSALLVYEQQASQKLCFSSHHSNHCRNCKGYMYDHTRSVPKTSECRKMIWDSLISIALLLAHSNNHKCKTKEHNEPNGITICLSTYSSRRVSL